MYTTNNYIFARHGEEPMYLYYIGEALPIKNTRPSLKSTAYEGDQNIFIVFGN